nr:immunoglobulin heavy chain junction region [Homo sapiens]MBN4566733.1 immunoglobulin heavy chain junction region [Homo sapiens]
RQFQEHAVSANEQP